MNTLVKVINSHLKKPITNVDLANKEVKIVVDKLIKDYYNSNGSNSSKGDKLSLTT